MYDMQLQELLREVFEPEVYGSSRQQPQKGQRDAKDEDAQQVKELVSLQAHTPVRLRQRRHRLCKAHGQDREHCLQGAKQRC